MEKIISGICPLRISFCGGGTDISPYKEKYGGATLDATINLYVRASIEPHYINVIRSVDFVGDPDYFLSNLPILDSICEQLGTNNKYRITCQSDVPRGSGLGSSSAFAVLFTHLVAASLGKTLRPQEVAEIAIRAERWYADLPGGVQDQYACAYPGFNLFEFSTYTEIIPIKLLTQQVHSLQEHLLLCWTGVTRTTDNIIVDQQSRYDNPRTIEVLDDLKLMTYEAEEALLAGKYGILGIIMHEAWGLKKSLSAKITNPTIDSVYNKITQAGAYGGKLCGAGGGGHMLLVVPVKERDKIISVVETNGWRVVPFSFDGVGTLLWTQ